MPCRKRKLGRENQTRAEEEAGAKEETGVQRSKSLSLLLLNLTT